MASSDATAVPIKNQAYRVTFAILDADGDLVTAASSLDSEISKDQGTFTDCTNEATEIATSSGMYYLDLTSTEMNADTVAVIVKTATAGAKTTPIVLYPAEAADIKVNVVAYGGTAGTFASGRPEVNVSHFGGTAGTFASGRAEVNTSHFGGTAGTFASGRPEVNTTHAAGTAWNSGAIIAGTLGADALTAAKFHSDVSDEFAAKILVTPANKIASDASGFVTVATNNDKTGYRLSATGVDDVWDEDIVAAHGTADTAGRALRTLDAISDRTNNSNLNALLGVADSAGVTVITKIGDVETDTQDIQSRLPAALVGGRMDSSVGAMAANVLTDAATAADFEAKIADVVWDEAIAGHLTAGSTGAALNAAGAAGDPWSTALPGAYGAGTAGKIIGDNINTTISSRAVAGDAMTLTAGERGSVADKLLGRTRGGGSDGGRTVAECLAIGRNKWAISGGTLTVYADDDTTPLFTAVVTTASGDPVTSVDPA